MALRRGHQRLTPEHLLKVLLEDSEGLCANLIRAAGGDPKAALTAVDAELDRAAEGRGVGGGPSLHVARIGAGFRAGRADWRSAPATALSPSSGCCSRWRAAAGTGAAKALAAARVDAQSLNRAIEERAQGPQGRQRLGRGRLRRAEEIHPRPDRGGARRQARPGHRPRRGDPPHDPGAVAPHQEQPGADRRARASARPRSSRAWRSASSMATCRRA